jgi:hypothetical protein
VENCFYPEFDIKLRTDEVLMSGGSFLVLRTSQCQARQPRCRFAGFAWTVLRNSRMEDGRRPSDNSFGLLVWGLEDGELPLEGLASRSAPALTVELISGACGAILPTVFFVSATYAARILSPVPHQNPKCF